MTCGTSSCTVDPLTDTASVTISFAVKVAATAAPGLHTVTAAISGTTSDTDPSSKPRSRKSAVATSEIRVLS